MTGPLDLQTHLRNIIAPSLAVGSRFSIGNVSTDTPKATVRFERTLALWMEGLNCPFMKNPTEYTIGVRNVSRLFLNEVRHIQPKGPCYIGGWSAGGVSAYEVTLQLMAMDEKVSKLFLIDSPCPVALKPLPTRLFRFFDDAGLLGSRGKGSSPSWLIPHFEYSVQNLAEYEHSPIPSGSAPQTIAIWAKEGVCENMNGFELPRADEDEPKTMKWLLDKRTDFGDNGWAQLLGQNAISCKVMGGNHFTMMTNDNVSLHRTSYLILHY
ncbi:Bikaverin polyketide synthase bik1 [Talaromyces pinophilus]|nr:Bikaverin polyketide synthase bik1 [Talaromyces pinophilus]